MVSGKCDARYSAIRRRWHWCAVRSVHIKQTRSKRSASNRRSTWRDDIRCKNFCWAHDQSTCPPLNSSSISALGVSSGIYLYRAPSNFSKFSPDAHGTHFDTRQCRTSISTRTPTASKTDTRSSGFLPLNPMV